MCINCVKAESGRGEAAAAPCPQAQPLPKDKHTHEHMCTLSNWPLDVGSDSVYPAVGPGSSQPKLPHTCACAPACTHTHTHTLLSQVSPVAGTEPLAPPVATSQTLVFPPLYPELWPLWSLDPRPLTQLTSQSSLMSTGDVC